MKDVSLSVVIPTHNRLEVLDRTIAALAGQASQCVLHEIVVADDGSSDGTPEWLDRHRQAFPFPIVSKRLTRQGGPARARNAAIRAASGDVVLFLGDDTVPAPGLLQRHALWHARHPAPAAALLGRVTWPPDIRKTPFMEWLERGRQAYFFDYAAMRVDAPIPASFFYTCNVSVKRSFLLRTSLFDEAFRFASHEDLELGHRLGLEGMQLSFDPDALAWHWHPLDLSGMCRRVYLMGYSAPWYWQKVGDSAPAWRRAYRHILRAFCGLRAVRRVRAEICKREAAGDKACPRRWQVALDISYWAGLGDNLRGTPAVEQGNGRT